MTLPFLPLPLVRATTSSPSKYPKETAAPSSLGVTTVCASGKGLGSPS